MYVYADRLVGEYLDAMDDRHDARRRSPTTASSSARRQDDPSKTRDMRRVSERFHRLEGILYLYGNGVKRARARGADDPRHRAHGAGARRRSARAGHAGPRAHRGARLRGAGAARSRPTRPAPVGTRPAARPTPANPAIVEHLKSLGYLGGDPPAGASAAPGTRSPQGDRNLAAMHFEAGRYAEAAAAYAELLRDDPDDAHAAHEPGRRARRPGALRRGRAAPRQGDRARAAQPRGVPQPRRDLRAAGQEGRGRRRSTARRCATNPQYEPSRQALVRLTGSADVRRAPRPRRRSRRPRLAEQAGAGRPPRRLRDGAATARRGGDDRAALRARATSTAPTSPT